MVAKPDLVITLPTRIAQAFAELAPLEIREPPLAIKGFSIHQVWHERRRKDPAHAWLRTLLAEVTR